MMLRRIKLALVATRKENDICKRYQVMDFASFGMNAASVGYEFRMLLKRVTPESSFEIFDMFYVDEKSMF